MVDLNPDGFGMCTLIDKGPDGRIRERVMFSYERVGHHTYDVVRADDGSLQYRTDQNAWSYVSSRYHREIVRHFNLQTHVQEGDDNG